MKGKLTLKEILIFVGALLGLVVFVFSFLAAFRVKAGTNWIEYKGIIWGATKWADQAGNVHVLDPKAGALALPLIGAILTFVGGLCACLLYALGGKLFKDAKVAKILMFVAAGLMVLGGVFMFIYKDALMNALIKAEGLSSMDGLDLLFKTRVGATSYTTSCALPVISGILGIVGGGAVAASQFVK